MLRTFEIPERIIRQIERIHLSDLALPEDLKMDETMNKRKTELNRYHKETHLKMVEARLKGKDRITNDIYEKVQQISKFLLLDRMLPASDNLQTLLDPSGRYEDGPLRNFQANPDLLYGVPQGAPTSPIISNLIGNLIIRK